MISLGCDKNLVDAEMMLGAMSERKDISFTDDETEADIVIINTCCFILDAKEESIQTILDIAKYKAEGKLKALIVTGCLAQRYKDEIIREIPEVDALVGTNNYDKIGIAIENVLNGDKNREFLELDRLPSIAKKRINSTGGWYAYLKIAEGCDKNCTYCIIPKLRGHYRSYPLNDLLQVASKLAQEGVKELILVAQETTIYGMDIYGKKALPDLLEKLCEIEGIQWIRILYCYPEEITEELIQVIKREKKICHYLDIPIQHSSNKILRRMARRTTKQDIQEMVQKLRINIPDIVLRTSLITGFPGETEEDFQELKDFVKELQFERLGVFPYSQEEDTPSASFENQVSEECKHKRREEIMLLQQEISTMQAQKMIGQKLEVFIEGKLVEENVYVGRSYMDSPGVDGLVFVHSNQDYLSGDFVKVRIIEASEYDLVGEVV